MNWIFACENPDGCFFKTTKTYATGRGSKAQYHFFLSFFLSEKIVVVFSNGYRGFRVEVARGLG